MNRRGFLSTFARALLTPNYVFGVQILAANCEYHTSLGWDECDGGGYGYVGIWPQVCR